MDVNVEFSKKLKKTYNHRVKHCYKNTLRLMQNKEIDKYVYGLCTVIYNNEKVLIRHAWGIKDGMIVDSTLGYLDEDFSDAEYYEIFVFEKILDVYKAMDGTYDFTTYKQDEELVAMGEIVRDTRYPVVG